MAPKSKLWIYVFCVIVNVKFIHCSLIVVSDDLIRFNLFNQKVNKTKVDIGNYKNCKIGKKLNVLVHGWLDAGSKTYGPVQSFWYRGVEDPYVFLDHNVVAVDWSVYDKWAYFDTARIIVPQVGNILARFVDGYTKACRISLNQVHLIGHSLGAHIVGFAGKYIQKMRFGEKIGRITGLDPAGPAFKNASDSNRLSKNDGSNVDTIISDAVFQGMNHSSGHVNFYVNGGVSKTLLFAHYFAPMVFQETILNPKYAGQKCESDIKFEKGLCAYNQKNYVGEHVDFRKPGDYFMHASYDKVLLNFIYKYVHQNWTSI